MATSLDRRKCVRESGSLGFLQVLYLFYLFSVRFSGVDWLTGEREHAQHYSAGWYQLLHLSLDELHDRRVSSKAASHLEFYRSCVVRELFPAAGRGTDCPCSVLSAAARFGQEVFQCRCARRSDVIPGGIH